MCLLKQWGDFFVREAGYATANAGYEECQIGMLLGKLDELVHIRTDGVYAALHRGDGITLTLQANALSHDGTKLAVGDVCRTASVHTSQIAAEHKDLIRLQRCDKLWCCSFLHNIFSDKVHILFQSLLPTNITRD